MQMIWLLGAAAFAKKVHFNLNGSELRGFPIKARSGQSNILYANPLAPKAVARCCLCPAVITRVQCALGIAVCQSGPFWISPSAPYPFLPYSKLTHTAQITFNLISSFPWMRHFTGSCDLCKYCTVRLSGEPRLPVVTPHSDGSANHPDNNCFNQSMEYV